MKTSNVNIALSVVAAIGLTVGGASTIPGANLPSYVLFWGLLLAGVCKAVSSTLVQAKGESDEAQGITPAQKQAVADIHANAATAPVPAAPAAPVKATSPIPPTL